MGVGSRSNHKRYFIKQLDCKLFEDGKPHLVFAKPSSHPPIIYTYARRRRGKKGPEASTGEGTVGNRRVENGSHDMEEGII